MPRSAAEGAHEGHQVAVARVEVVQAEPLDVRVGAGYRDPPVLIRRADHVPRSQGVSEGEVTLDVVEDPVVVAVVGGNRGPGLQREVQGNLAGGLVDGIGRYGVHDAGEVVEHLEFVSDHVHLERIGARQRLGGEGHRSVRRVHGVVGRLAQLHAGRAEPVLLAVSVQVGQSVPEDGDVEEAAIRDGKARIEGHVLDREGPLIRDLDLGAIEDEAVLDEVGVVQLDSCLSAVGGNQQQIGHRRISPHRAI